MRLLASTTASMWILQTQAEQPPSRAETSSTKPRSNARFEVACYTAKGEPRQLITLICCYMKMTNPTDPSRHVLGLSAHFN